MARLPRPISPALLSTWCSVATTACPAFSAILRKGTEPITRSNYLRPHFPSLESVDEDRVCGLESADVRGRSVQARIPDAPLVPGQAVDVVAFVDRRRVRLERVRERRTAIVGERAEVHVDISAVERVVEQDHIDRLATLREDRARLVVGKVAAAAGVLRYLKQRDVAQLCEFLVKRLEDVGYHWKEFSQHGRFLDDIEDLGGLLVCPPEIRARLVRWMTLCYLGEPGEYGEWGRNRKVFYSDSAVRRIEPMLSAAGLVLKDALEAALNDKHARTAVKNLYIARRAEALRDLIDSAEE